MWPEVWGSAILLTRENSLTPVDSWGFCLCPSLSHTYLLATWETLGGILPSPWPPLILLVARRYTTPLAECPSWPRTRWGDAKRSYSSTIKFLPTRAVGKMCLRCSLEHPSLLRAGWGNVYGPNTTPWPALSFIGMLWPVSHHLLAPWGELSSLW